MRRGNYTLTPTRINNAKAKARLYKLSDGGGLFVEVSTTGQKTWRYRYRFAGSRQEVKIRRYPEIGVTDAQARHFEFRSLGADHVDAALAGADDFTGPLQGHITAVAGGDIWNRPGLDRPTRSMIKLAMLTALNRPHELKLQMRGTLRNGVTREGILEVLVQPAIYCGVPVAMDSFRVTRESSLAKRPLRPAPRPRENSPSGQSLTPVLLRADILWRVRCGS